jgi:hypothetical protein
MAIKPPGTQAQFRTGAGDLVIIPLVMIAVLAKRVFLASLSFLVRVLDYAFVLVMELVRLPLFVVRVFLDGVAAALQGLVSLLPLSLENRQKWRDSIAETWSRVRAIISYKAFEEAVHHAFERGMGWVFRTCRRLTPSQALYVIIGAILWLPISLGIATSMHALLIAKAASLPPWMQLLHPFATIIAKSKLLVLPVYPAAWPQAKKHAFVQMITRGYWSFEGLSLVQKVEHRYRQAEHAIEQTGILLQRVAAAVGLTSAWRIVRTGRKRVARRMRRTLGNALQRLSGIRLIGPLAERYLSHLKWMEQHPEKLSEKMGGAFKRWSVKLSAEYYEGKEREKAAKILSELGMPPARMRE